MMTATGATGGGISVEGGESATASGGVVCLGTANGGTSGAGGAVAHGGTLAQLQKRGRSSADLLSRSDSATGLRAVAGLIESLPTGTNVADVALGWRLPEAST